MRIIGGRDYYDQALAGGRDEDIVYVRKGVKTIERTSPSDWKAVVPKELEEAPLRVRYVSPLGASGYVADYNAFSVEDGVVDCDPVIVWFCGRRYPGMRWSFSPSWQFRDSRGLEPTTRVYWSREDFEAALAVAGAKVGTQIDSFIGENDRINTLTRHFDRPHSKQVEDWLIENKIAIAVRDLYYKDFGWFINCDVLKNVQFQRRMGPWEAMQELSMYVGGVLASPGRSMVEITDPKVKIAKHGFDKYSFRRLPENKDEESTPKFK